MKNKKKISKKDLKKKKELKLENREKREGYYNSYILVQLSPNWLKTYSYIMIGQFP